MTRPFIVLLAVLGSLVPTAQAQKADFHNRRLSDDHRVELVLQQLTLSEKISLLSTDLGVPRLGIPTCGQAEGLHGLALGGPGRWGKHITNADGSQGQIEFPTTIFPQAYGLGATWNPELIARVGNQMATEMRYYYQSSLVDSRKALVLRAPNADLARDPRWGRTEESFGEDPFLTAVMTEAMVRGIQGSDLHYWKAAALMKHFLANSNEDGRDSTSSDFDNQLFREYYSYPFYRGVTRGGSRAFMASYNAWNGVTMCVHPALDSVARRQWGQNGIICTDGGGLRLLVDAHHAYPTMTEGAAAIVKATTGQFLDNYESYVREALAGGLLSEADIDRAIRGNLYVALKLGLLDGPNSPNPYLGIGRDTAEVPPFETPEASRLAREVTAQSVVLLKNDSARALLPLDIHRTKRIALVGPYANHIVQDWYSGKPPYQITILEGIRNAVRGQDVEVRYVPDNQMGRAEQLAAWADVVLVCVGNHPYGTRTDWKFCPVPGDGREAVDRKALQLPDEDLVKLIHRANPNTVLVLISSFPYSINWSQAHLPAIVQTTHCSQEQGNGLADVLFGKVNPAGRLTQTWVRDITDLPPMMDYDIRHGRTYMYFRKPVLYPFGYGLSYTTFSYGVVKNIRATKTGYRVTVPVTNTGSRDGDEVIQAYVASASDNGLRKRLCGFARVSIPHGKTVEVELDIEGERLGHWDEVRCQFALPTLPVQLQIGASSEDIRRQVICR
jgi:beta-glucosidase